MFKQNFIEYILIKLVCLASITILLSGCGWMQILSTTAEVVEHYPSDNYIEDEIVEPFLEEQFGLEEGSLDLSIFSPEEEHAELMTALAIAAVLAGGMQGAGSIMSSSAARSAAADELEEKKRQRKAELFSKQRDRQQKSATDFRAGQSDIAKSRAQILQGIAQNINLGGRNG